MKAYIIWESKEDRPIVHRDNFGNCIFFLSKANAQAYLKDGRSNYSSEYETCDIKEVEITVK